MRTIPGIAPVHIFSLFILSSGFINHVMILPLVLSASGRDAWISVLICIIPYIVWIFLITATLKRLKEEALLDYLERCHGKSFAKMTAMVFFLYFLLNSMITFRDTITWTKTNYLYDTPLVILAILLGLICFAGTVKGIKELSIIAVIILPIVALLGVFIAVGNIQHKDYSVLFPIMEDGVLSTLRGCVYAFSGLAELCTLLFLKPFTTKTLKPIKITVVSIILIGLMIGPLMGAIAEFGPREATHLRYPAYEQWKLLTISSDITRMDFLSIFQWISGSFIRICLLAVLAFQILSPKRKRKWLILFFFVISITYTVLPLSDYTVFQLLYRYIYPIFLLVIVPFILIISSMILFGRHAS